MRPALFAFVFSSAALSACSGGSRIAEFQNGTPRLVLEDYFNGDTHAWGIFVDRFGKLRAEFKVEMKGTWDGKALRVEEKFIYTDGRQDQRVWTFTKTAADTYIAKATDTRDETPLKVAGNAANMRYSIDLKAGGKSLAVRFNDWLYLQGDGVMINRASVKKYGIEIGTVNVYFHK